MIPAIELIPHCVGYSRLLVLQLSGFCLFPPRCRVLYRPCVANDDTETLRVLEWFSARLPATVAMEPHVMNRRRANRRAIGRNECALSSKAPIVGFIDCDYVYSTECFDKILNTWPEGRKLAHPGRVYSSKPERGMELIEEAGKKCTVVLLDLKRDFPETQRKRIAIGGLQFFDGPFCRERGYCGPVGKGRRFRPADRWQPTKEDSWARAAAGEDVTMPITALYRVRHTVRSEGHKEDARL